MINTYVKQEPFMNSAFEVKPSFWIIVDPLLLHGIGFGEVVVGGTVAFAVVFVVGGVFVEVGSLDVAFSCSTSTFGIKIIHDMDIESLIFQNIEALHSTGCSVQKYTFWTIYYRAHF